MSQIAAARDFSSLDDLFRRLRHRHAGSEGDAAAAGQEGEADRGGVGDDRPHLLDRDAEHFGRHHRHRGARAADIGIARHRPRVPSSSMCTAALELAADVEPEARGDAAPLVRPELASCSADGSRRLERLDIADIAGGSARRRSWCRRAPRSSRAAPSGRCRACAPVRRRSSRRRTTKSARPGRGRPPPSAGC